MLEKQIFNIETPTDFKEVALQVFNYQYEHVPVYRQFCDLLKKTPRTVRQLEDIPFLPIQFFKSHIVIASDQPVEAIFTSSGTTGSTPSTHHVAKLELYIKSFLKGFDYAYGSPNQFTFLALLPSYLEREGSSLIYMVDRLIEESTSQHSGFYLNEIQALTEKLSNLEKTQQKTILLGVSYALLDLMETYNFELRNTLIMETGGMKGKRAEMIKEELHSHLKKGYGVSKIHSEYGMTELLSQAYSKGEGIFDCPPWMKVVTRDTEDALTMITGKTGGINVIDLANLYSCSFIATQDLGKLNQDGTFEVMGRFDHSDIRGCNLMVL